MLVRRRIQDRDLADPGAPQGKGQGASRLAAADNADVVIDAGTIRNPVGGIGTDQPKGCPRIGIRIIWLIY